MLVKSSFTFQSRNNYLSVCILLVVCHVARRTEAAGANYPLAQPQIVIQDGNIYFTPAEHKNLILKTSGRGKVLFNNLELDNLVGSVQNSTRDLNSFKSIFGAPASGGSPGISSRLANIEQTVQRLDQIESLDSRLTDIERRVANGSDSGGASRGVNNRIRRLNNRVDALEDRLNSGNPCYNNPCSNGGTCIPTIYGAFCYCPSGWEGERCDRDVNECANFAGTELGCQNGATCVNRPGSYQCQCVNGYMGIHCTKRSGGCSSASAWELCGHGICVDQHGGSNPYTCICDAGWTHNGRSPACSVDVDECSQYHTSCSTNPPVSCINTPGSYVCGPCPPGYTGNGHQCMDVNECLLNNGGCSVNPMVQCTNTVGSRSCGPCPPGYMGNGMSCQYVGMCHMNNGGCHPLARCVDNPMIGQSFVQCVCPAGYTGTGMGLHGCVPVHSAGGSTGIIPTMPPSGNLCLPNPCQNGGACHSYGITFSCSCPQGFVGQTCATRANPCLSQPCQNGGTCQATSTGFSCTCPSDFTGDICERQTESCGGYLIADEGSLKFPQTQATYDHSTFCEWMLHTSAGKVFNITFTNFHLEGGARCAYDYLEIRDGTDTQSPLVGRYCGEELPRGGNIISTHNSLQLTFRSDHSVAGLGFEFSWNSTDPVCGGVVENQGQAHGTIKSPGYPGKYPHDRDCAWQIKASLGKRLQLVFATFQLESHDNCSYDYVEVRDGLEDHAPILEKLCNTTLPAPVISSGPYLTVRFHSDDSSSDYGFLITYSEVPGVPGCGGLLTSATAVFSSPQHPQPYAHGLECDWLIRLPSVDDKISISFLTFELEDSYGNCLYDYVEIHDGSSLDSPLVGRFCGRNMPPPLKSSSNLLFVRFKSDESIALGGFSAKYEAVCGGEITSPDGILRSPFYPANYPKLRDCVYVISQPVGKGINLQFLDFEIEPGMDTNCYFDYLEIRDGDSENSTLIGHFCGPPQAAPEMISSSLNYLWVRFKTDGSVQNRGFMANFSTFDTGCGGILRSSDGTITSPGHPEVYPHGVRCMWVIRGEPGQIVRLNWDTFNLEGGSNCRYDYVEIYDNSTSFANGTLVGKFCGNEHPPMITSSDTTLTVIFRSDHSDTYDGFMASYRLLNASTVCGGNFFTEYGMIRSPRYPNNYPNGKSCTWVITAPRGRQIELNVTDFEMEDGTSSGCRYDYLEIRNGPFATSPLIGKFCGNRRPPTIIPSFSNSLFLKFKTDTSHVRRGFKIMWDATSTGCGGVLNSPSGSISSPNYPSPYGGGMECVWKIQISKGSAIQMTFVDVDLQHSTSTQCWGERVEILDGPERNSPSLGKYCSEDHAISVQSTGSSVTIKFVTSVFGGSGRGFLMSYRTFCNRVLSGFHGVIESPNYPNPYPHNRNCTWTIEASKGNKVNISFSHFDVEAPYRGNCSYDFIEISEWKRWHSENKTVLGTYCGTNRPRLISSSKDTVSVSFVSDYSHAGNGFRLEWRQYGCGGRIIGDFAFLKSPDYPRRYAHGVECVWMITTEIGTKAQLTVYDLDIEQCSQECYCDGLEIYGGPDNTSPLLSKLCQTITTPTIVASQGNNMYIRFYSDSSIASKGFYGYVNQVAGGCGGTFEGISGYVHSPNYPNNYDHNDDCFYLIRTDRNHVVELKFEDFDLERHINCSYDHVAIYDGPSRTDPVLLLHCGNQLPDPPLVRASGNQMLVHLVTDASAAAKGFKAKYTRGCGATLRGRQSGVITTPNFPGIMSTEGIANCSWIIEGTEPDDRVTLTFTYIDMSADETCSDNYVEVLDGSDYEAPSLYKGCSNRIPPAITSRGNAIVLHIAVNHYYGHGFRAVYDFSSTACGGMLTSANGSITSPNYPNGYPANIECIWQIKASAGNQVQMSFRHFEIETSEFCNSDFVEIHEGSASGPLLGHYCGNDIPSNVTAGEQLWILFRTDAEGQAPGFWADFNLVHGVELSGSQGSIASPMYPNSFSGTGLFTWRVTVNESNAIQISFIHYGLDAYDSQYCEYYDSITIYDGYDEDAPVLLSTCAREKPDPVTTTGNVVYIKYNRVGWYNSFFLQWQQIQGLVGGYGLVQTNVTGCGGNFSLVRNNETTLISPGFPSSYMGSLNCEWSFDAPQYSRIRLKVNSMILNSHTSCLWDKVELYDGVRGLPNYQLNKTLCLYEEQNKTYLSSGRFLQIALKTEHSWASGFNFTLSAECGGYVRDSRGTISSPNYPDNYVVTNCIWKVVVRPGRTIRLTFNSNFDIYSSGGQCVTDQLILRNGANDESPFLGSGRYCGSTGPTNLETSGNHLYVHFTTYTHAGKGFAFTYEEVSLGCGGDIQLTDNAPTTNIQSPNFPQMPAPYTECEWIFTAPQGEAVQINFLVSFEIHYSPGCQKSGVEVRDGGTAIAQELGIFCRDMPGTLKSTGNVLYVRYYTNVLEPRTGFKAEVKIATCGGVHTGRYGTISSPGFPATYEVNLDCVWTIKVPRGLYIVLEFENFNLGSSDSNCTNDKINITEQSSPDIINPRNWTFCGQSGDMIPNRVQSGSNEIQIRFVSDGQRERQQTGMGFNLRYRARPQYCGGNMNTPTGFITTPGYPQPYPNYVYCVWRIYAPEGRRIRLEFIDFDLEERITTSSKGLGCFADTLWIYQGVIREVRAPLYNSSLCGSTLPPPVESTSSEVTIYFRTDGFIAHRGFKLHYTTDLPILCGGTMEESGGIISSPNSTTGTPNTTSNIFCEWKTGTGSNSWPNLHTTGNGTTIATIHRLQIPSWGTRDPLCSRGFLRVSPANPIIRYKWRKLCGSFTNEKIYLPGNSLMVEYITEDTNATFNMSYRTVPCGGALHGPAENITSLNFPLSYPVDTECIWMVEFSRGSQVKVKFYDLDLDDHQGTEGCDRDYVVIRNGRYPSSPALGKFCGTYLPNDIVAMSNDLWIEFHSDGNADGGRRGFKLGLEEVFEGCGGVLHRKWGQLVSPKAELSSTRYPHNTECEWIIESIPGYTVNLVFFDRFDIENSTNCTKDSVEIFQKESLNWVSKGRFCGRQLPSSLNTTSTSVKVVFKSNENIDGDGFKLYWYSPCGGVFREPSGIIRSAHFDLFNHSQHVNPGRFWSYQGWESIFKVHKCDYFIKGEPDDYILLQFLDPFEVQVTSFYTASESELNDVCPKVNVTVWQGNSTNVEVTQGPVCGRSLPPPFVARGSAVISYNYQPIFENYGFRVEYAKFECGGEITSERRIRSPGHPFTSASNMNCTWVARGPPNKVVRFNFMFLELEFHQGCVWDSVRLYDGPVIDETKLIGTYCGNLTDELPKISSRSNSMTIYFSTDSVIQFRGFEGTVEFTVGEPQGCGGTKNLTAGQVTLSSIDVDGDGKYDTNLDCQWLLIAPAFKSVEITFSSFNLEDSQGGNKVSTGLCPFDFVEIRDGPGPNAQLLAKLCGSTLPAQVVSSMNFMWIRFFTDGSINFPGFTFTARDRSTPCGQLVYNSTDSWQYLQSPGYPSNYDNNVRCRWRIDGSRTYDEVDITFVDLDIESSPDCRKDRLEIRDVSSSYSTPEGITGPTLFSGNGLADWRFRNLNLTSDILQNYKYCGSQTPPDFFTVGRSADIVFHTDGSTSKKGFKVGFKTAGCNRTYENFQGRIFSPEWPTHTPIFSNCLASIRAPNGTHISLYFNFFSLPTMSGQTACTEAGLQIRDGNPSGALLAQYCGTSIPDPVFSVSNMIYIKFFSRIHPTRGFDITYTTTDMGRGCGGNVFHTGGSLSSPMYPGNYSLDKDCVWRIRVPGGLRVQIEFTNFMFGGDCQANFLEISSLDSHDPSATPVLFSRYCRGDVPGIYNGNTDTAIVRYKTSTNNTGVGWRLTFKGVYPTNVPISSRQG